MENSLFSTGVQSSKSFTLAEMKAKGFTIQVGTARAGYKVATLRKGDENYVAVASKDIEGEITLNTLVLEGTNSQGEARLYLTNKAGVLADAVTL